jgi:hypothetical protein
MASGAWHLTCKSLVSLVVRPCSTVLNSVSTRGVLPHGVARTPIRKWKFPNDAPSGDESTATELLVGEHRIHRGGLVSNEVTQATRTRRCVQSPWTIRGSMTSGCVRFGTDSRHAIRSGLARHPSARGPLMETASMTKYIAQPC